MNADSTNYGKCSKISSTFLFKMLVIRAGIHKLHVRIATGITLIRLILQKQSDLDLHCLSMPFWQATSVQNLRTSTIIPQEFLNNESQD